MNYRIVNLPSQKLAGVGTRTANAGGQAERDIQRVWQEFMATNHEAVKEPFQGNLFGVYTHYASDFRGEYDFYACSKADPYGTGETEGAGELKQLVLPGGKYARFDLSGDPAKVVKEGWEAVWNLPLQRAYTWDFEEYLPVEGDGQERKIHLYISIV